MRLLANENVLLDAVVALRTQGHDVAWVRTDAPGSTDQVVMEKAVSENRVLVLDMGKIIYEGEVYDRVDLSEKIVLRDDAVIQVAAEE